MKLCLCLRLQDLDSLVSTFTAKPWRDGCLPLICFILRTKAAFACSTYSCKTCRAHTCTCFKPEASNEPRPEPQYPAEGTDRTVNPAGRGCVAARGVGSMQPEGLGRQVVSSKDCQEGGRDGELEGRGDQGA